MKVFCKYELIKDVKHEEIQISPAAASNSLKLAIPIGIRVWDTTKKWPVISIGCWSTDTYCCNGPIIHGMTVMDEPQKSINWNPSTTGVTNLQIKNKLDKINGQ